MKNLEAVLPASSVEQELAESIISFLWQLFSFDEVTFNGGNSRSHQLAKNN